ncbi:hypothetical protein J6590_092299 [Homalodisca vitripennis]|nr:hypothetical protein J6590_015289 [Homalodisca vitripennis]KAG8314478.1 hypothetical protein J6590_092299 [Homalodisca vitripennis]
MMSAVIGIKDLIKDEHGSRQLKPRPTILGLYRLRDLRTHGVNKQYSRPLSLYRAVRQRQLKPRPTILELYRLRDLRTHGVNKQYSRPLSVSCAVRQRQLKPRPTISGPTAYVISGLTV